MRARPSATLLVINLMVFLFLAAALEIGARLFESEEQNLFEDAGLRTRDRPFVEPHPERGFALVPGYSGTKYNIDQEGFREGATGGGKTKLLALGESTTFGWEVRDGETYPAQLEALAKATGLSLQVINAGVPSYSSTQVLLYLEELLRERPVDLVLVSILWNDVWYSSVLNWYPDLLIFQQPSSWLRRLLKHSALLRLILLDRPPEDQEVIDRFNEPALAKYRQNLSAIVDLARKYGIPLAFVDPPFAPELMPEGGLSEFRVRYTRPYLLETAHRYRSEMATLASELGVPLLGHRLSLAAGGGPGALFLDILHPNAEGNRLMASDVLARLKATGLLAAANLGTSSPQ